MSLAKAPDHWEKGKGQQNIIVEKVNIEAVGQAAIGVYEGVGANAKKGV